MDIKRQERIQKLMNLDAEYESKAIKREFTLNAWLDKQAEIVRKDECGYIIREICHIPTTALNTVVGGIVKEYRMRKVPCF